MTKRNRLIISSRYPVPGTVKSRMIPVLGDEGAATLYREMTEYVVAAARAFVHRDRSSRVAEVKFTGGDSTVMRSWLGTGLIYSPFNGSDVGDRTRQSFSDAFKNGAEYVVIVGTDCPGLTESHLSEAFAALHLNDVVIGPITSGGYYLLGIGRKARLTAVPALFKGIAWGTGFVYGDTVSILKRLGLSYTVLETLPDIDRPEDLPIWEGIKDEYSRLSSPVISIVIPTLNDAKVIDRSLDSIESGENIELIIADGGSSDDTVIRAITHGAHVVESLPGRARQLNAGASEATGKYILFLNPETILETDYDKMIREILADPSVGGGAFTLRIDSNRRLHRIVEHAAQIRAAILHLPYGDQGLFMRTAQFTGIGSVPDYHETEDIELMRFLRKFGKIVISPGIALTSAPRWTGKESWRTALLLHLLIVANFIGIPPKILRNWFGDMNRTPIHTHDG